MSYDRDIPPEYANQVRATLAKQGYHGKSLEDELQERWQKQLLEERIKQRDKEQAESYQGAVHPEAVVRLYVDYNKSVDDIVKELSQSSGKNVPRTYVLKTLAQQGIRLKRGKEQKELFKTFTQSQLKGWNYPLPEPKTMKKIEQSEQGVVERIKEVFPSGITGEAPQLRPAKKPKEKETASSSNDEWGPW